jgi:PIN domain nuclease of toxin-antitoxin system
MNKLLLDTHILLWSLLEPERLSDKITRELENPANELWISPITTWEVIVLSEKGRVELDDEPVAWMKTVLNSMPFKQATVNHEVAMQSRLIKFSHQDPADRFIAASAAVYDLILVTADQYLIKAAKSYAVLPNHSA